MESLKIKLFGPIKNADVHFGDLTLLVGPQASGKSIFLQLLKLIIDKYPIRKTVEQFGYIWKKEDDILNLYFGENMYKIWRANSEIFFDDKSFPRNFLLPKKGRGEGKAMNDEERLFYVPAQRILSIADGRPKTFMEFDPTAPYVLRYFSETLRLLLQNSMGNSIFPVPHRLKDSLRNMFNNTIFHDGKIVVDDRMGQKKFRMQIGDMDVPFITWSAGQKEFMPLLLAFYRLCPPSKVKKDSYQYVVIEEPEMGLHPQAIKAVILQVIDLLSRDYKVIISTHSPVWLEFAWAFNYLKANPVKNALNELFDLRIIPQTKRLFENILKSKTINAFYFSREQDLVVTKDITSLDANSDDIDIAEWGGISQFAGKAADIVSKYCMDEK
jgi:energy-coupling factor transporter ATP-binding protein EcfA2